jgi:hypothetical protein
MCSPSNILLFVIYNRCRFDAIYQEVLTPKFQWLLMDPMALSFSFMFLLIGFSILFLGVSGLTYLIRHIPQLDAAVVAYVGSAQGFARMIAVGWYFLIAAHSLEATFVYMAAKRSLRLKNSSILEWVLYTLAAGLPIVNRFLGYLEVQKAGKHKIA